MPARKDREREYKIWQKVMLEKNMRSIVRLVAWFFNLINLGKLDISSIIYIFCRTKELYEMFGILESEKCRIILAIKAVIEYHDKGEEFRLLWNFYWQNFYWLKGNAFMIEAIKKSEGKRYVFNPYMKR
ncbi:MAG: hypothetical protein Q7S81_00660 [bacterium]|nr:hypothetical protein [bacterium]